MRTVKMLKDGTTYSGRYKKGDELVLSDSVANALVEKGAAKMVDEREAPKREEDDEEEEDVNVEVTNPQQQPSSQPQPSSEPQPVSPKPPAKETQSVRPKAKTD